MSPYVNLTYSVLLYQRLKEICITAYNLQFHSGFIYPVSIRWRTTPHIHIHLTCVIVHIYWDYKNDWAGDKQVWTSVKLAQSLPDQSKSHDARR